MLSVKERRIRDLKVFLDDRPFYELAQQYRHANAASPADVVAAWEAMKAAIVITVESLR